MRIGLVGYGHGGRYFHAPLIATLPGVIFVGVVTRSPERRLQLASDHPGLKAFDSIGQIVEAGVDALVISTTLKGRPALVLEAIEHGVAVVSDKPFAANAEQAQALITAAERQGVLLSVYQNRRWDSDFLTLRKLIDAGALGAVTRFESRVERYSPDAVGNASGGGWLRDLGSHLVDQALQLFGPVDRVFAQLQFSPQHPSLDHGFFVSLTHANGVISHLWGSALQNSQAPRFRVSGTLGCYTVEGLDGQEAALMAGKSPKTEGEHWGLKSIGVGAGLNRVRSVNGCRRRKAAGRSSIASCKVLCKAWDRCRSMPMMHWKPPVYWTPRALATSASRWFQQK